MVIVVENALRNWLFKKSLLEHYWDPHSWFGGFVNLCFFADYVASRSLWRGDKLQRVHSEKQLFTKLCRRHRDTDTHAGGQIIPQGLVGKFFHCMFFFG